MQEKYFFYKTAITVCILATTEEEAKKQLDEINEELNNNDDLSDLGVCLSEADDEAWHLTQVSTEEELRATKG